MCTLHIEEETHLAVMGSRRTRTPSPMMMLMSRPHNGELTLFDISWEDVLIPHMCSLLSLKDLFNLRSCSRTALRFAEAALERRQELQLSGNNTSNIEHAFKVMARCCRRLEHLHLARCKWLTDELLLPLLNNNKQRLSAVNLNECINITALSLQPIIVQCKELRVLKLSKCQWLTTGAVDALTLHQSKLVEFDISHCGAIGERCLIIFFRKLNKLTILSLANTPSVTDQVLIQIGNYCRELEHINLIGCASISDYGVHALTRSCPQLQSLMVQRCPLVTERVLAPLRGRLHIDRPSMGYNLPAMQHRLYLQV
ncbi:F-box/LRR-repeat protein 15 isoform X3 [Drosophila nasuta]|uniref:F-box/LRR-repeat protein 15 isoform X2 n=1 Tax=Drosophila albomicans TaxID=7291 RepID=A0A6P8WK26_DROAB|nr:F-box/LRR-repeat protein 15 isoform X2 [Drosophila albomicans]XP_060666383.1 F-box/LRR-repeat protein 15 isoform X3 [Drosophila nasuta]